MKTTCFFKECSNFNGDFDCILHYSMIQNDAHQKIMLHYNALKSKMEEIMIEHAKYEKNAKESCKRQFEAIFKRIKSHTNTNSSPESHKSCSPKTSNSSSSSVVGKSALNEKVNSPARKAKRKKKGKESVNDILSMSIDSRPNKEKRTKQTRLSFYKTSSAKKRTVDFTSNIDDDITFCEELEKAGTTNPNHNSSEVFNFDNKRFHPNQKDVAELPKSKDDPLKLKKVVVKQENDNDNGINRSFPPPSPELFLSDLSSNSNSVIYVEQSEKEIFSIPDRTYNPLEEMLKDLNNEAKRNILLNDSSQNTISNLMNNAEPTEQREIYKDECLDCQIFYENVAEKKSAIDANNEINNCPIKCDGYKERVKKLDKTRKKGVVVLKCNSKFTRRRKEDPTNITAPGIWDLNVEPRKSKPLFSKKIKNNINEDYETPDL